MSALPQPPSVSLTWFSKHKATLKRMLSAVTPPLGKMAYTTKEGDGVKSAVNVKGMEKEPFNTEEGNAKCFHHSPTEISFCPPFFYFIIPQCQTDSCCYFVCSLSPFSDPMHSIFPQVIPAFLSIISLILSFWSLPADMIASSDSLCLFLLTVQDL